jgi:hypothetical protein
MATMQLRVIKTICCSPCIIIYRYGALYWNPIKIPEGGRCSGNNEIASDMLVDLSGVVLAKQFYERGRQ